VQADLDEIPVICRPQLVGLAREGEKYARAHGRSMSESRFDAKAMSICLGILLLLASIVTAMNWIGGDDDATPEVLRDPIFDQFVQIDFVPHDDPRKFNTTDLGINYTTEYDWAVFGNEEGGNCCEHYLATTKEGLILNFGGEYPTWSPDRGHTWEEYLPSILGQVGCREWKPTVPGQEGLGEGSIVQATNGDIISMGWFPYPSNSGADQFYAFFYDSADEEWQWCYNRTPEPFYDRSWQVEVVGPISGGLYGSGPWASLVISNFWHQVSNIGGQISTDGLNYEYFDFPDRDATLDEMEVDLTGGDLGVEWDFTKPHKEMRAFPVPSGGLYFPNYFLNGDDAYVDTGLRWWKGVTLEGNSLPTSYCAMDASSALHCLEKVGTNITHMLSWDGGENFTQHNYSFPDADNIEEWEWHSQGENDLFVLAVRYQHTDGLDRDVVYHAREYSQNIHSDQLTHIGLGDLDSTSGAGADIRFDFASMGILPDGGAVIAYHDSSDVDPLFAVELTLPVYGPPQP
jgi:hypothetical protein